MRKTLLTLLGLFLATVAAFADEPFRNHRYDGFKVLSVKSDNIVFVGNSITNMHEWWEAFGNGKVLNRGNSGAVSDEMLANLESVLAGKPAKIFFMIGTNDVGTAGMNNAARIARNIRTTLKRCAKESPSTTVYVQGILPATAGSRTLALEKETNDSIKKICQEFGVTYIDMWDEMMGITTGTLSYDYVHLTATAYRIWCKKIAQYVGSSCVYPDDATDNNSGLGGVHGMRSTYFAMSPIKDGDIIMLGDATINGGEWHELLHSDKVKTRGSGWGVPGVNIANVNDMLNAIFKGRSDNGQPATVCIYLGASEVQFGSTDLTTVETSYKNLVNKVRELAPNAKILLQALMPCGTAATNTDRIVPFNEKIKALADAMDNAEYVDTYTPMVKDGVANPDYFTGIYIYGKGYAKLSQVLAAKIGNGVTATTDAEAAANLARFNARKSVADALTKVASLSVGTGVGQYTKENLQSLTQVEDEAYALLANASATNEQLTAKGTELTAAVTAALPKLNLPTASTDGNEVWYQLNTPLRNSLYTTSNGAGSNVTGTAKNSYARSMWKFVKRAGSTDTYDIINRADGTYISPVANYDAAITSVAAAPASGWELSYSNTPGYFIIRSGTVQLNQTTNENLGKPLYNWSSGKNGLDRNDTGCQFQIVEAGEPVEEPTASNGGTLDVSLDAGAFANPNSSYNKLWTSSSATLPLTLSSGSANNMSKNGSNITIAVGSAQSSCTYTLTAPEGYIVTGYEFDFVNLNHTSGVTLTAGDQKFTTSQEVQHLSVTKLTEQTATFVISGENKPIELRNFRVTVRKPNSGIEVSLATGAYANPNANFNSTWTSSDEEMPLTLTCPNNNMSKNGTNITIYAGSGAAKSATYTLTAPSGYCITGYEFDFANLNHDKAITLTASGQTMTTTQAVQHLAVEGLNAMGTTFTISGDNVGVELSNFYVYLAEFDGNMQVSLEHGDYANPSANYNKTWTSKTEVPQLTLTCPVNNMGKITGSTDITVASGSAKASTFTLSVPNGYVIKGYSFKFQNYNHSNGVTLTSGGQTFTTSASLQTLNVTDIQEQTVTFSLSGENSPIRLTDFFVKVGEPDPINEPQHELFVTKQGTVPYRIPAITTARNGHVIAVSDYRHSGQDIGLGGLTNGRIDLHYRISQDNGATWGPQKTIVEGRNLTAAEAATATKEDSLKVGYGDACIVADRESDKVLVLSCCGAIGFPSANRQVHQGIARFISENNGETWSTPTDISEQFYTALDGSTRGPVRSMFIGSGRIHQSRYTKVGEYYRLYCSTLVSDVNGTYCNYVYYSDDFGLTWKVLGDINTPAVPSGANEPKAEELPDGSVVVSSRINGGRFFNVFTFTDSKKAEGSWGTTATSNASNNGVDGKSNCNGELLIVPAVRKADGKQTYLALQSIPFGYASGSNRANVGIFYKDLDELDKFNTSATFAANWDGKHQATTLRSAYSVLTQQADKRIGFMYEEETYVKPGGYTIIYKNYSLDELTDGAYEAADNFDEGAYLKTLADDKLAEIQAGIGDYLGMIDRTQAPDFDGAIADFESAPSTEKLEKVNNLYAEAPRHQPEAGKSYTLRNKLYPTYYLSVDAESTAMGGATENGDLQRFTLVETEDGNWNLLNEATGAWVGPTLADYAVIQQTESAGAGIFRIESATNGESAVICTTTTNTSHPAIHLTSDHTLVSWGTNAQASRWYIRCTDMDTPTGLDNATIDANAPARIYDLQGRRVLRPGKGIYIVNGQKVILK